MAWIQEYVNSLFVLCPRSNIISLASKTSKDLDVTIFVWDPNPASAWEPLGMFEDIIEENEPVPWQIKNGRAELYLLLVCYNLLYIMLILSD